MLTVESIEVAYGATQVLFGVSLAVGVGETVALLGRNGMGKTTTIKTIVGALRPRGGHVRLDGRDLASVPAHQICRSGIGYVPEGRRIFQHLSVDEQLVAFERRKAGEWTVARVYELFPQLVSLRNRPAGLLSGGEQQMLAIGRALVTNPRLLILDEATEGLAPLVRERIWQALQSLKASGLSILVVDKNVEDVTSLADKAFIMQKGLVLWNGSCSAFRNDTTIQRRYLSM